MSESGSASGPVAASRSPRSRGGRLRHPVAVRGDGEHIVPAEAETDVGYACPVEDCDDPLRARGPYVTGTVRHFYHPPTDGGCGGGGESDTHRLACSHAASALGTFYRGCIEEEATADRFRVTFDVAETPSPVDTREADALCTFTETESGAPFGNGLIIEVQHKHRDKDIEAVTADYYSQGYSVAWLDATEDFDAGGYRFDRLELEARTTRLWPPGPPLTDALDDRPVSGGAFVGSAAVEDPAAEQYLAEARGQCDPPRLDVPLPAAGLADHRDALYAAWTVGAGIEEADLDLGYRLSETNASRSCSECGDAADWYLFLDGVLSGFWCDECATVAPRRTA